MKYELEVLAAITQYQYPNIKLIVNATGISERKVQLVIKSLYAEMGMELEKHPHGNSFYFSIKSWGLFESGSALRERLDNLDLVKAKAQRLRAKKRSVNLKTLADKEAYYESVKWKNYRDSMRLEGIDTSSLKPISNSKDLQQAKEELLQFYAEKAKRRVGYA